MKIIYNNEELEDYTGCYDAAYDVDTHELISEKNYKFPILVDFLGTNDLGPAYKIYTQADIRELKKFIDLSCE